MKPPAVKTFKQLREEALLPYRKGCPGHMSVAFGTNLACTLAALAEVERREKAALSGIQWIEDLTTVRVENGP